ncbi:MAG: SBBP repeat-containing protein, partial [Candidatus Aminicenantes bacterium]
WRETIDVRIAKANPGASSFEPSTQVSRYLWFFEVDGNGNPVIENDYLKPIQVQYNAPNFPLFKGGTVPFIGDYIDLVPAPMFIYDAGSWRFNTGETPSDPNLPPDPFVFYVSWADNRDVRPPAEDFTGVDNPWTLYWPPDHQNCRSGFNPGMRNQNIYVSRITSGITVGCPANYKLSGPDQKAFVVNVENMTGDPKSFNLNILNPPASPGSASFLPDKAQSSLTIDVVEYSSISRHVFVESSSPHTTIVKVSEPGGGGFTGYIYLYLVATGGSTDKLIDLNILDGGVINWSDPPQGILPLPNADIINPTMFNPTMFNPTMFNPTMFNPTMFNPTMFNPTMFNPTMFNANIYNPTMFNPTMFNGNVCNPTMFNPTMFNRPTISGAEIVDKFWQVTNTGDTASSYTLKTIAGDELPDGYYNQLLVYKVHKTPATDGDCTLLHDDSHELLINIGNPNVTPDIDTYENIVDPELTNVDFTNTTFSLSPGEEAIVILRVIDASNVPGPPSEDAVRTLNSHQTPNAEEYADNVGAVVVSHSSTEGNLVAITLQILPDSLNDGKAGVAYISEPLRAIGGTGPYSWSLYGGSLPFGITLSTGGVISGTPKEAGEFAFTVKVLDYSGDYDTQKFTLLIHPPDPITVTMTPQPAPDGNKFANYSPNVKFTASGGVLPYSWTITGEPIGLGLTTVGSDSASETMEITGAPQQAGDFGITITVTDDFQPTGQQAPVNFTLCVKPLPLIIKTVPSPLPDGDLGLPYNATITVNNAEATASWNITGLPNGLSPNSPYGDSITITGTPTYDPNVTYPAAYDIVVEVTDHFTSSCYTRGWFEEIFTITINPKQPAWFVEETQDGEAIAVAIDDSGNVYVTGFTVGESTGKDYYTVKYDEDGNPVWNMSYNGPGNGNDIPSAIAVNSSGVYVTGSSAGKTSGDDIYTIKYDPENGNVLWEKRYDGPSHLGDGANDLTLDNDGNIYIAGFVHRGKQTKHADYCTIKYSPSGDMLWDERYDSTRNGSDYATAIAVDSAGNVYISGKSQESLNKEATTHDYLTIKYNSSGRMQWEARDDGSGFGDDEPTDISIDLSGNIYVTGITSGGTEKTDYYTVKLDHDGNKVWDENYNNDLENGDDMATAIAVDESTGEVYVTGKSSGENGYNYATIKYGSDGTLAWVERHDSGIADDEAIAVAVDGSDIYVAGYITKKEDGSAADKDFFIIKYNTSGDIIWIASYDGPSGMDDLATAMEVYDTGIYVAGYSWKDGSTRVYAVGKYEK